MTRTLQGAAALLAIWLAGGAATAQQLESPYNLGRVQASGGNEIREVPGGVLFMREYRPDCDLPPTQTRPLAASFGDSVSLAVEVIGCPQPAPEPETLCRLRIGGHEEQIRFQGWSTSIPLTLPDLTGIYPVELQCEAGGQRFDALRTVLYLTYSHPLAVPTYPPKAVWYERAASWGAGLSAEATEEQVITAILASLYEFGQRHWRYGYCQIEGNRCSFGNTSVSVQACEIDCFPDQQVCKCHWEAMVEADSPCNFADCFVFSDTLQYISAVMGIGGLAPHEVFGGSLQGFMTHGWIRSLDPAFTGNFLCGPQGESCSYLFYNHELRKRGLCNEHHPSGCKIFDATFGRVYQNIDELIAESADEFGLDVLFPNRLACFARTGYGLFRTYRGEPKETPANQCLLVAGSRSIGFTNQPPQVSSVCTSGDQPTSLTVTFQVEAFQRGTFTLWGALYDARGKRVLPGPFFRTTGPTSWTFRAEPGVQQVSLSFSLATLEPVKSGTYTLKAALEDSKGLAERWTGPVTIPTDLGGTLDRAARLEREYEIIRKGGSELVVQFPVSVRDPGSYLVEARLFSGERTISYSGKQVHLAAGDQAGIEITFPAGEIAERRIDGSYAVTLTLHNEQPLYPIDSVTVDLGRIESSAFGVKP